jgi:hypothetical protein
LYVELKLEQGQLANDIVLALGPILASFHSEPMGYQYLMVYLMSDKQETANLIAVWTYGWP